MYGIVQALGYGLHFHQDHLISDYIIRNDQCISRTSPSLEMARKSRTIFGSDKKLVASSDGNHFLLYRSQASPTGSALTIPTSIAKAPCSSLML